MKFKSITLFVCMLAFVGMAYAQNFQPAGDQWIATWWMLDGQITNTGGFTESAAHDWLSEGTGGVLTDAMASTNAGVRMTPDITVSLPDNGGDLQWTVLTIDVADGNNMSSVYGLDPQDNFETYAIIVIDAPTARTTTIHPAHDDYGHIWLNGEKVYDNDQWTGAVDAVTTPTEVTLNQGGNFLLFRCGESGGSDYFNLHFEASDADLRILPTSDGQFVEHLDVAVHPAGKTSIVWGALKAH